MAAHPVSASLAQLDVAGAITNDVECKRCGYNLRGLSEAARCPECATAVGLSIRGDFLRFSDPQWVETVARGMNLLVWLILFAILISIAGGVLAAMVAPIIQPVAALGIAALSYYGTWLLTAPDPSRIGSESKYAARRIIRVAAVGGVCGQMVEFAPFLRGFSSVYVLMMVVGTTLALVGVVGEIARFAYLEQLALRVPDQLLAKRCRFLKWALPISWGTVIGGGLGVALLATSTAMSLGAAAPPGAANKQIPGNVSITLPGGVPAPAGTLPQPMFLLLVGIVGVASLIMVVFGFLALRVLFRMRKALQTQARLARETWAAERASAPA